MTVTGADTRLRPLTGTETKVTGAVAAGVGALGLIGFVNSFAAVRDAAEESFGRLAWTVPTGIDLGIAVFSALDIVLARLDMRLPWLRLVPWSLTAATVYLNLAHAEDGFAMVAHVAGPALWVIAVEVGAHVARVRAGLASGRRMDRIRASRWLLAPVPTLGLWRRMVLWEIRSYPAALARERDRVLALTDLQDAHGRWAWRWRAPRRARALYRLGEMIPAAAPAPEAPPVGVQPPAPTEGPSVVPGDGGQPLAPSARPPRGRPTNPRRGRKTTTTGTREDAATAYVEAERAADRKPTRDGIIAAVRAAGHRIGTGPANDLFRALTQDEDDTQDRPEDDREAVSA